MKTTLCLAALLTLTCAPLAYAQAWPSKPIRVITPVPYKGAPQAVTDVIGGNGVHMMLNSIPPVMQHVKSGET